MHGICRERGHDRGRICVFACVIPGWLCFDFLVLLFAFRSSAFFRLTQGLAFSFCSSSLGLRCIFSLRYCHDASGFHLSPGVYGYRSATVMKGGGRSSRHFSGDIIRLGVSVFLSQDDFHFFPVCLGLAHCICLLCFHLLCFSCPRHWVLVVSRGFHQQSACYSLSID